MNSETTKFWRVLGQEIPDSKGEYKLPVLRRQLRAAMAALETQDPNTSIQQEAEGNRRYTRLSRLLKGLDALDRRDYAALRGLLETL